MTVRVAAASPIRARLSSWKRSALWVLSGASSSVHSTGVSLTFDDGPHPEFTPQVLDVLRDAGVTATFFMLGECVLAHPDIVRRAVAEGHRVGAHGMAHNDLRHLPIATARLDVQRSIDALSRTIGVPVTLFRPPYRGVDLRTALMLRRLGLQVEMANHDSYDWKPDVSAADVVTRVNEAKAGDVVLLHDIHAHTVEATAALVADPARFRV